MAATPSRFSVFAIAYFLAVLGVDQLCNLPEQLLLGALTYLVGIHQGYVRPITVPHTQSREAATR